MGEDGSKVTMPEDKKVLKHSEREVIADGKLFNGIVTNYDWDRMWGLIKPDSPEDIPEDARKMLRRDGQSLYFLWKDIQSDDKVRGVNKATRVSFTLYKDQKGVAAGNIVPE